jgi:nucleotide-binding universal stress UspA family protein
MTARSPGNGPPYRHLLCPVDFSGVSRTALEWTLGFAREIGARVTVLHVLDETLVSVGNLFAAPWALDEMRGRAEETLAAWKRELDFGNARVEVVEGVPSQAILSAAHRGEVDLLVMGTFGLSGFQKLFLGSVTESVLHRVKVPLLTLSPNVGGEERRAFLKPKTLLMALDLGEDSAVVVRHGVWLAAHYRAKILAAHAAPIPLVLLDDRTLQMVPVEVLASIEESLIEERRTELQALLAEFATGVEIAVKVGAPFDVLRSLVRERSVDLVVMGAGGRGAARLLWLGSTTHKMVRSAECPILIAR